MNKQEVITYIEEGNPTEDDLQSIIDAASYQLRRVKSLQKMEETGKGISHWSIINPFSGTLDVWKHIWKESRIKAKEVKSEKIERTRDYLDSQMKQNKKK